MNTNNESSKIRWENYFLRHGEDFYKFWSGYVQGIEKNILYVLGQGFDPRMCLGFEKLIEAGGSGLRDCLVIEFDEGPNSPSIIHSDLVTQNINKLDELIQKSNSKKKVKNVKMWSDDLRRIGSRSAADIITEISDFSDYTDLIIDISALPQGIYFPLIAKVLYLLDLNDTNQLAISVPNFHIIISENAELDNKIKDEGIDDTANFIHGFAGNFEIESTAYLPKVWIPIIGEDQEGKLIRIRDLLVPDEICPVFPSPSSYPRRGDNLLIEYRQFLFDQLLVEPSNIIYVAEQNPFEVYRSIYQTIIHYNDVFEPLDGCKIAISALSSKLMSIGALLAAYELKNAGINVGVADVDAQGYQIKDEINTIETELFSLWIAGDCYEP